MLPTEITSALAAAKLDSHQVTDFIEATLDEDLAYGPDVTTEAIFDDSLTVQARMVARAPGCLAGVPIAAAVPFVLAQKAGAPTPRVTMRRQDGERVEPGDVILEITAGARTMLTAERTLLNLASQLSGVASAVAAYVDAIADAPCESGTTGTKARVRDTRKTIPGMRVLQKYAVRCGGGENHRMGLGDAVLIKDNHIAAAGSLAAAVQAVRAYAPQIPLEVECDTLEQVREATDLGVGLILLDNMSPEIMTKAVTIAASHGVKTEASGGLTLSDAAATAACGVDYISVGALTHSAPILDLALDM